LKKVVSKGEKMEGRKEKRVWFSVVVSLIFAFGFFPVRGSCAEESIPKIGPVKMNPHPSTLERKTVLLRWNGKYNGDKFLSRVRELLIEKVKNVKVIKLWEVDSTTAVISKKMEVSEQIAFKIAALKPNIVISAQAD
jgi:hypothetical protein